MQNSNTSGQTIPNTNNNNYSPSIPISLYREVTAELQGTKAELESVQNQNQQLVQQNQQLRREIEKLIGAAMQLQQTASTAKAASNATVPQRPEVQNNAQPEIKAPAFAPTLPSPVSQVSPVSPVSPPPVSPHSEPQNSQQPSPSLSLPTPEPQTPPVEFPEHLFTELPDESRDRPSQSKQTPDISGVWLIVAIFLIVVAFFGAGYWVVRPLLQQQQQQQQQL
ncbi:MAG: hypothetical protein SXA11_25395 [Cyanobacteriota bacterium]|nr:hypothetical protein [Cyanobacteriota bacterium]